MTKKTLPVLLGILVFFGIGYYVWNTNNNEHEVVLYDVISLQHEVIYEEAELPEEQHSIPDTAQTGHQEEEPSVPEEEQQHNQSSEQENIAS
jgi:hypothetical protein